jgi:tetratricopeptide (TPR) repeat protein
MLRTALMSAVLLFVVPDCLASPEEPTNANEYAERGLERAQKGEYEKSIADFTVAIRLDPQAFYYMQRGGVWHQFKKYDKAIADFDNAIQLGSANAAAYLNRGMAWTELKQIEKALDDFDRADKLGPKNVLVYRARAYAWVRNGDFKTALSIFDQALELDPKDAVSWNDRAWFEATCPDAKYRNGKRAVEQATKACELSGWKETAILDTLAAADAEAGDFTNAIKWQTKARDGAPTHERADYQSRLDLYTAHKPCRNVARD